jgi:peroxiredoxin
MIALGSCMMHMIIVLFLLVLSVDVLAKDKIKTPDFNQKSISGQKIQLKKLQGKVVVVNFWAAWCSPCVRQLPYINELYLNYRNQGLVVLGVSVDEENSAINQQLQKLNLDYPILHDQKAKISKAFENLTMPSTVLIDKQGDIVQVYPSFLAGGKDDLCMQIENLLAQ